MSDTYYVQNDPAPTWAAFSLEIRAVEGVPDWSLTIDERGRVTQTRNGRTRRLWFGPRRGFIRAWSRAQAIEYPLSSYQMNASMRSSHPTPSGSE
jgi:hypothetical protein